MKNTVKIGLTGVMGAGKSSVIRLLNRHDIDVLDCDEINRELLKKGNAGYLAITAAFGKSLLDQNGALDTEKMSDFIFSDTQKKEQAESLLHPLIQQEIKRYVEECDKTIVVVEVPLLFEVHWEAFFDELWVVACEHALLLQRLKQYRSIDAQEALKRMKYQLSQEEKCARADIILYNNGSMEQLDKQLSKELKRISEGFTCCKRKIA